MFQQLWNLRKRVTWKRLAVTPWTDSAPSFMACGGRAMGRVGPLAWPLLEASGDTPESCSGRWCSHPSKWVAEGHHHRAHAGAGAGRKGLTMSEGRDGGHASAHASVPTAPITPPLTTPSSGPLTTVRHSMHNLALQWCSLANTTLPRTHTRACMHTRACTHTHAHAHLRECPDVAIRAVVHNVHSGG